MHRASRLESPSLFPLQTLHQPQYLLTTPHPHAAHEPIKHHHKGHHRDYVSPEQMRPVAPKPIPASSPQGREQDQSREKSLESTVLKLKYTKARRGFQRVLKYAPGGGIVEMVEGEREEPEDLLLLPRLITCSQR